MGGTGKKAFIVEVYGARGISNVAWFRDEDPFVTVSPLPSLDTVGRTRCVENGGTELQFSGEHSNKVFITANPEDTSLQLQVRTSTPLC